MIRRILTYVLAGLALWAAKATLNTYLAPTSEEALYGPAHPTSHR